MFEVPDSIKECNDYIFDTINSIVKEDNFNNSSLSKILSDTFELVKNINIMLDFGSFDDYPYEDTDFMFSGYRCLTSAVNIVSDYLISGHKTSLYVSVGGENLPDDVIMKYELRRGLLTCGQHFIISYHGYKAGVK